MYMYIGGMGNLLFINIDILPDFFLTLGKPQIFVTSVI